MRVYVKRILQVALISGGLLAVGTGAASAAPTGVDPAQALATVLPAVQESPVPALESLAPAVLHTVPASLFQLSPSTAVDELAEPNLNAPVGSELTATELPALPAVSASVADPGQDERADTPLAGIPLLSELLPNIQGLLPAKAPALAGVPNLTQNGPGSLVGSATSLLGH
ncbi:hypothetical protein [Amycolatopsis rifamycinica]|uniref:Secreted protein n=1 Tax=Amycolatopsis rifamycinica TaxID=287986 RepID=A0A066TRW7_9PSEU|nr:hypothetical protein [Amycolatopsis rifamycinica]KDN17605.1 hypothetical protein DV20_35350 [Amycolatopsis rifamycinica]